MKRATFTFIFLLSLLSILQSGCIRLWGGATYTREKPGETVQKTYVLDTYEFTSKLPPKTDVQ